MIPIEPEPGNAGEGNKQSTDDFAAAPTPGATARSIFLPTTFLKTVPFAGAALGALAAAPARAARRRHHQATQQPPPEALVTASRANERTATAPTNLSKQEPGQAHNFGQDLPYLLNQMPSVVVNSGAGAGVGYTDIRIRGTSNTGINTTINGVPLNDPESHGAFLIDLPDLASSTNSLQIQRGVGTSQNGDAAFGASLNISTLDISTLDNRRKAYAEIQNTYGPYQTGKNNVSSGTGHFTVDGRLSRIVSDGYMNRAASDLKSYYFAAGYQAKNTRLKFKTGRFWAE